MHEALDWIPNIVGEAGLPEVKDQPLLNVRPALETSELVSKKKINHKVKKWAASI